jgi:FkbM family methyltransferase
VFIDCGGNDCSGVRKYTSKIGNFHKIFAFEPNPKFHNSYEGTNITLIKSAVWTENTTMPFYVSKDEREVASSLLSEKLCKVNNQKIPYFKETPLEVDCIDFSQWLKETVKPYWHVTIKMDIEGAEYAVLKKMLNENTIMLAKNLYVEFHLETIMDKKEEHFALVFALSDRGVKVLPWD